ncbi:MAG TPA: hypothetical protein VM008_18290 [Phycisphaerae bacterium]|nr:hypothetical protein [Phycisphaerae bacterium]
MQIRKVGMSVLAMGFAVVAASAARAASVSLTLPSDINQAVNPGVKGGLNVGFDGQTYNGAYVGQINWTVAGSTSPAYNVGDSLSTYCIQGLQDVYTGSTYTYNIVPLNSTGLPLGGGDAGILDSLAAMQIQGLANQYFPVAGSASGNFTANQTAAAFQLAVWEIEYDGGLGAESFPQGSSFNYFSQGNLTANANDSDGVAAISLANTWLNNFTASESVTSLALVSDGAQDQLVFQPGGGSTPPAAPLPAAFPAGAALLAGMFGARKLKRK